MGKRVAVFLTVFFYFKVFGVKNAKKYFSKKKMVLRMFFFIKLTFRWLQTGPSDLKKYQTIEILLMVDFYVFLKMIHFSKFFEIFEIHQ